MNQEDSLYECLKKHAELRLWAAKNDVDPWGFRQALQIALGIDTNAAIEAKGAAAIRTFDILSLEETERIVNRLRKCKSI